MAIAAALLILLGVVLISHQQTLDAIHASQVRACERGNVVREAIRRNARTLGALAALGLSVSRLADHAGDPALREATALTVRRYHESQDALADVPRAVDCAQAVR